MPRPSSSRPWVSTTKSWSMPASCWPATSCSLQRRARWRDGPNRTVIDGPSPRTRGAAFASCYLLPGQGHGRGGGGEACRSDARPERDRNPAGSTRWPTSATPCAGSLDHTCVAKRRLAESPSIAAVTPLPLPLPRLGNVAATETHQAIETVFRIERARLIAGLVRMVQDWAWPRSWRRGRRQ